jgi:hypothetical protein
MMKKSCGLCVDNGASHTLEIVTQHGGSTDDVLICWPCLQKRVDDLMHDLDPVPHNGERLGGVVGFAVTTLKPVRLSRPQVDLIEAVAAAFS